MKVGRAAYVVQVEEDASDSEDGAGKQIWNDLYSNENLDEDVDGDSEISSEMSDASDRSASPVLDDTNCECYSFSISSIKSQSRNVVTII